MSERDDDGFVEVDIGRWTILAVVLAVVIVLAYFEVDSRIQLREIRDLQRRVGQLEQERR